MTHSLARTPPGRLLLALVAGTVLFLAALSFASPQPASADWVCSQNGQKPWEHYDHWFLWIDDREHRYVSGHTHSNGEHHHIWDIYDDYGFTYVGQTHDNCGV